MGHEVHSVATNTHGRVLVRRSRSAPARGVLAGFHGYSETAAIQLPRLDAIPGADAWALVSVQALHRFYRGRTTEVGASWMTHEDRETAIADNVAYVTAALRLVADDAAAGIVYAGFSQGVAMAFRAAVLGPQGRTPNFEPPGPSVGVIAVGGDVPPELLADPAARFPPILLARATADEWYTAAKFDNDVAALRARGADFETFVYDGPHEWTPAVSPAAGAWLDRIAHR
jgi:predicted esterase